MYFPPGYLIYDMIHYYLHYGSPSTKGVLNKYLYHIKRYHYQHHFVHHDKGMTITLIIIRLPIKFQI